ncbi:MAG: ABC transporter permease [Clostridiales bacterium]|nr:ABC transporter permease [Clostridiales bacterium]MDE6618681.1 ABC transporter permease [Clostridiales bacterium]
MENNLTVAAEQTAPPKKRKIRGIKRSAFAFPYLALSIVFVIVPLFIMLYYAFTDGATGGFTGANFVHFFSRPNIMAVMGKSFLVALLTTVLCLILAYPLALALSSSALNKKFIIVMLFVLPMWINSLLRTYAIKIVLYMMNITNAWVAVTIGMVYDFFPFMLLPLYSVVSGMDKSLIEASQDLGASPLKTLIKVRIPLSLPGIISGILMVFMPTVSTFAITDVLGDTSTYMFGNIINQWFRNSGGWNIGSAYSFILLILIAATVLLANKLTKGKTEIGGVL